MGSYRQPAKRKMETLLPDSVQDNLSSVVRASDDLEVMNKRAKLNQNAEDDVLME